MDSPLGASEEGAASLFLRVPEGVDLDFKADFVVDEGVTTFAFALALSLVFGSGVLTLAVAAFGVAVALAVGLPKNDIKLFCLSLSPVLGGILLDFGL